MGIFHYKAVLKEHRAPGEYVYTFFPDFVMAEHVIGEFSVTPGEWQPNIIAAADAEAKGLVSTDSRCVLALTSMLKAQYEHSGSMPNEISRIS